MTWMKVLVTVKAYPGVGRTEGETVCVAGVRLDTAQREWIRLWPVGFRELNRAKQFKKWQIIELDARRTPADRRPESYRPNLETLELGEVLPSGRNWEDRWRGLGELPGAVTLCGLQRVQERTQPAASLGLVKVAPGASVTVEDGPVWTAEKQLLAELAAQPNLLRDRELKVLRPAPYQVVYRWHCFDPGCNGHRNATCDWEAGAASRRFERAFDDPRPALLENFGRKMLDGKDTYFFVGNQHQRPSTFMVLGAFYPPLGTRPEPGLFQ